jgi:hypothetical protein
MTGYVEYLRASPHTIPFAASPNKVYACRASFAERYRDFFRRTFQDEFDRSDHFFGYPVDTYGAWQKPYVSRRRRMMNALLLK